MTVLRPENLDQAIALLESGGVIIYPTETSYGLGCDATNAAAVDRIFAIKGRPPHKGATVLLSMLDDAPKYIQFGPLKRRLMQRYWPGAVNLVADVAPNSPIAGLCAIQGTQAVRVSSHPLAAALARGLERPLVSTSANRSGESDTYKTEDILRIFSDVNLPAPDAFLDAGNLPIAPPSTVVRFEQGIIHILRQGSVVVYAP